MNQFPKDYELPSAYWWVADLDNVSITRRQGYTLAVEGTCIPSGRWWFPELGRFIHVNEGLLFEEENDAYKFVKKRTEENLNQMFAAYHAHLKKGRKFLKKPAKKRPKPKSK